MTITLEGKPVSVNELYRGRRFLTPTGKQTKLSYAYQAKKQYRGDIITGQVAVTLNVYFITKGRSDLDNVLKGCLDSLTGVLWKDDRQIDELHVHKRFDKQNPRIEISVVAL